MIASFELAGWRILAAIAGGLLALAWGSTP